MHDYQQEFIEFAIRKEVLRFGRFTLKSGRSSPYFFNSGQFNDGESLWQLGKYYVAALEHAALEFDMVFGPAYKGIPLASAVVIAYAQTYQRSLPYAFNRKEAKDHGEGGVILGAPLSGKVVIIDDVITAGTSVNQAVNLIERAGASATGVSIALDRQERGKNSLSAVQEVERRYNLMVIKIITLDDLVEYLENNPEFSGQLQNIYDYRDQYGVKAKS